MSDQHVTRQELMLLKSTTLRLVDSGHLLESWSRSGNVWYTKCRNCGRWAWVDAIRVFASGGAALSGPCPDAPIEERLEEEDIVSLTHRHDAMVLAGLALAVTLLGITLYEVVHVAHVGLW